MEHDPNPRSAIVGLFGYSSRGLDWNYDVHPGFTAYGCGLMAFAGTPIELRTDPELLREFPPQPLDGLTDGDTCWRTPEMIAEDRRQRAWIVEMTARLEAGKRVVPIGEWSRAQG